MGQGEGLHANDSPVGADARRSAWRCHSAGRSGRRVDLDQCWRGLEGTESSQRPSQGRGEQRAGWAYRCPRASRPRRPRSAQSSRARTEQLRQVRRGPLSKRDLAHGLCAGTGDRGAGQRRSCTASAGGGQRVERRGDARPTPLPSRFPPAPSSTRTALRSSASAPHSGRVVHGDALAIRVVAAGQSLERGLAGAGEE